MHDSVRQTLEVETNTTIEDYGDLIVQNVGVGLLVPAEDIGGGDFLPFIGKIADYDVMGDVDRYGADEAVLLAQKLRGLQVTLSNYGNDPTNIEFRYTFGFNSDLVAREDQSTNDPSENASTFAANEVDNDVLYHLSGTIYGGIEDANGSSSPVNYQTRSETNYLQEVGVLPEVSARENLNEVVSLSTTTSQASIGDQAIKFFTNWQLYWLETDEPVEGRQIDLLE